MLFSGLQGGNHRPSRDNRHFLRRAITRPRPHSHNKTAIILYLTLFLSLVYLPSSARGTAPTLPSVASVSAPSAMPVVMGANYSANGTLFSEDEGGQETKEQSFKNPLILPKGSDDAVFTSEPTRAPIDFSDVAPHWYSDTPNFTTISIELRTSKDGQTWADWQLADPDDIIMETDPYTETFGFPIPVDQVDRTHRFVQSRITLHSAQPGTSPTFYSLSYTFINAG
ncbi:MAG: hypothetical protein ABIQ44_01660, partial [Chloroflexia bacterium]